MSLLFIIVITKDVSNAFIFCIFLYFFVFFCISSTFVSLMLQPVTQIGVFSFFVRKPQPQKLAFVLLLQSCVSLRACMVPLPPSESCYNLYHACPQPQHMDFSQKYSGSFSGYGFLPEKTTDNYLQYVPAEHVLWVLRTSALLIAQSLSIMNTTTEFTNKKIQGSMGKLKISKEFFKF